MTEFNRRAWKERHSDLFREYTFIIRYPGNITVWSKDKRIIPIEEIPTDYLECVINAFDEVVPNFSQGTFPKAAYDELQRRNHP